MKRMRRVGVMLSALNHTTVNITDEFYIGNDCHVSAQIWTQPIHTYTVLWDKSYREKYPYKRGIALPLKTWITLTEDNIDEIDQALQDVKKEDNDF